MTDTRLKNCPFCGGEAEAVTLDYEYVRCDKCHFGIARLTIDEAIAAWNRRTPPAAVPDGWAIVPCEPDDEMTDKGESALIAGPLEKEFKDAPSATWAAAKACYRAMISAAPAAPTEARDDQLP